MYMKGHAEGGSNGGKWRRKKREKGEGGAGFYLISQSVDRAESSANWIGG